MSNKPLTQRDAWKKLKAHRAQIQTTQMRDLFAADAKRFENFHVSVKGMLFDYSKHIATDETMGLLMQLARQSALEERRDAMFAGEAINTSEKRAALHTALRGSTGPNLKNSGESVAEFVEQTLAQIKTLAEKIRGGNYTDVVHIGIGGSDLGPQLVYEALKSFADGPRVHFVSNMDGAHITQTLKNLKPQSTVFIIASKTFTTLETIANATVAMAWSGTPGNFFAVTANDAEAKKFGIAGDHILPLREWIGGRYSLWSAIGLPIAVACGFENFEKLLDGAHAADTHFKTANLEQNIPAIMGLLGIWYRNFHDLRAHAILPYAQDLHRLPAYIRQLDMESNGKSVDRAGKPVDYQTAPVIFGEPGTNGQHAFFQLLHQGTDILPCDFIAAVRASHDLPGHHTRLLANALAQSKAMMEGDDSAAEPYRKFPGNRPSSTLLLDIIDPWHMGLLLAFYEHKTFVQGAIWDLNSFDQWGVELGKKLAINITEVLENNKETKFTESSTPGLIRHILKNKR